MKVQKKCSGAADIFNEKTTFQGCEKDFWSSDNILQGPKDPRSLKSILDALIKFPKLWKNSESPQEPRTLRKKFEKLKKNILETLKNFLQGLRSWDQSLEAPKNPGSLWKHSRISIKVLKVSKKHWNLRNKIQKAPKNCFS